jgi:hypothetical protein
MRATVKMLEDWPKTMPGVPPTYTRGSVLTMSKVQAKGFVKKKLAEIVPNKKHSRSHDGGE